MEKILENKETERTKRKERILSKIKKIAFRSFVGVGILLGGSVAKEFYTTYTDIKTTPRYKITKVEGEKGQIEYKHEDKETTQFLNILAGKEQIPEYFLRDLVIKLIQKYYKNENDSELAKLTLNELVKKYDNLLDKTKIPGQKYFDLELYNALWYIHQKYGNPRVKFRIEQTIDRNHRSSYAPYYNKLILSTPYNKTSNYIRGYDQIFYYYKQELGHASAYTSRPIETTGKTILDSTKVKIRMSRKGENYRDAYDNTLYSDPNSTEALAHEIIRPQIEEDFRKMTPKRQEHITELKKELKETQERIDKSGNEASLIEPYQLERKKEDLINQIYNLENLTMDIADLHPPKPTTKK